MKFVICHLLPSSREEESIVTLYRDIRSRNEGPRFDGSFPNASSNKGSCPYGTTLYIGHPSFGGSFIALSI